MPSRLALTATLLLSLLAGCHRNSHTGGGIVGSWASEGGDYPLVDEYRADGNLVQHVGSLEGKPNPYRLEGGQIIVSIRQPDGQVTEDRRKYELTGDTLVIYYDGGVKATFKRVR